MLKLLNKVFLIFILLFSIHSFVSAAESRSTITTYYPSPRGVFEELTSNVLAVGDTDGSGVLGTSDLPPASGQAYVARSVIFNPVSATPAADSREGELVYVNSNTASTTPLYKQYMYYDGSAWQLLGEITDSVMYVTKFADYLAWGGPTLPPSCPTNWLPILAGTDTMKFWIGFQSNWRLPCYRIDKNCRVMYIKKTFLSAGVGYPDPCPRDQGWYPIDNQSDDSGDVNIERTEGLSFNYVRICTTCEN